MPIGDISDTRFNQEFLRFMDQLYGRGNHPYSKNKKEVSSWAPPEINKLLDEVLKF